MALGKEKEEKPEYSIGASTVIDYEKRSPEKLEKLPKAIIVGIGSAMGLPDTSKLAQAVNILIDKGWRPIGITRAEPWTIVLMVKS